MEIKPVMNLRSFFNLRALADYLDENANELAGFFMMVVILIIVIAWSPLNAAEPGTSDPSDITRDAIASLETAKAELAPKLDELQAEEMRLKVQIDGTIGDCREIRGEYIQASVEKSQAEGAVAALEEVSRKNPSIGERIADHLEAARLLVTVHETKMGETLTRAEAVEASQNDLLTRREEIERQIREIRDAAAVLDAAIAELKLTTNPPTNPQHRVATLDRDWSYPSPPPDRRREAIPMTETVEAPPQIAACMDPLLHNP